mgnify:CR=1 FL=1
MMIHAGLLKEKFNISFDDAGNIMGKLDNLNAVKRLGMINNGRYIPDMRTADLDKSIEALEIFVSYKKYKYQKWENVIEQLKGIRDESN